MNREKSWGDIIASCIGAFIAEMAFDLLWALAVHSVFPMLSYWQALILCMAYTGIVTSIRKRNEP